MVAPLIATYEMNGAGSWAHLSDALTAIVTGHRQNRIDELFPWDYAPSRHHQGLSS